MFTSNARIRMSLLLVLLLCAFRSEAQTADEFTLQDNTWEMLVFPGSGNETLAELLDGSLAASDFGSTWIAYGWLPDERRYAALAPTSVLGQASGLWIIQVTGNSVSINVPQARSPAVAVSHVACNANGSTSDASNCIITQVSQESGFVTWHMLGNTSMNFVPKNVFQYATIAGTDCYEGCELGTNSNDFPHAVFVYDSASGGYIDWLDYSDGSPIRPWTAWWLGVDTPLSEFTLIQRQASGGGGSTSTEFSPVPNAAAPSPFSGVVAESAVMSTLPDGTTVTYASNANQLEIMTASANTQFNHDNLVSGQALKFAADQSGEGFARLEAGLDDVLVFECVSETDACRLLGVTKGDDGKFYFSVRDGAYYGVFNDE